MRPIIEELRGVIDSRLCELADEVKQLERVRAALDEPGALERIAEIAGPLGALTRTPAAKPKPKPASRPARRQHRGTKPGRDGRAPVGYNKQRIMDLVATRPGITSREVAEELGLGRNLANTTINRYLRSGELERQGDGLRLGAAPPGA